jgi:formate C-acetyltransferase
MNERVAKLKARLDLDHFPICTEKYLMVLEHLRRSEGEPEVLRRAAATAKYLDNRTIFIEEDELIVGNVASRPMGLEADPDGPTWTSPEMAHLRSEGFEISKEDEEALRATDDYWAAGSRTLWQRMGRYYDDHRLWPFIQSDILFPGWSNRTEGRGHGSAGGGWGLGFGQSLIVVDFAKVLNEGLGNIVHEAEEALANLRYDSPDSTARANFLNAVVTVNRAVIRHAHRFADLATKMAEAETVHERRQELQRIAEICRHVPENPARSFPEAIQSFWFTWAMIANGTAAGGRFDQLLWPFYASDLASGTIDEADALELLECLRIKVMQISRISGGKSQREKWAGLARWNNWVIGGVTQDGVDATNPLTYLILEAARDCPTPHHTITLRVHEGMPDKLMHKALEVVRTGIGMPAFVSDRSYIDFLTANGVGLPEARDYALAGCLDAMIPGRSRNHAFGMFIVPLVLVLTLNNGIDPRSGEQLGPSTGALKDFKTFDDLMSAFKDQLAYFMGLAAEEHNILLRAQAELFPDAFQSGLMADAIEIGHDALDRTMPFENGSVLNPVGMITAVDSLAAVKKLVFDERYVTAEELAAALAADWENNDQLREQCLDAPKYGNGDSYADDIAAELYHFWADTAQDFRSIFGAKVKPAGVSITAYGPAGAVTSATPDGRQAGENLADGTVSAAQGRDRHGPTALIRSAMAIDQRPYQSTLLNLKFHPSAMATDGDLDKLGDLIRVYFENGGKHIQFNVVSRDMLLAAQRDPAAYKDLIVRVAGYSAYFVQLNERVQADIIERTEHATVA